LELKPQKTTCFSSFFSVKMSVFESFLMKNWAKTIFFECFLGLKNAILGLFDDVNVSEMR
jgi:hypothetical protein